MNTEQPLVSIIIPTYNRAHLIGETLDSVLAQTYSNWECIIVDDGSSDNTDEVVGDYVKKDPRFKYVHRPDTHLPGGNGARNYGFLQSKGEYIQWFDSDDLMLPNKLEEQLNAMFSKKVDLVISDFTFIGKKRINQKLNFEDLLKFHISQGTINTPMCFFDKIKLKNFTFDETIVRGQEFEFFTRIFANNRFSFFILPIPLTQIRVQESSITGKYLKGDKKYILSDLKAKLYAHEQSMNYDVPTQQITLFKFKKALWKSFVFKHKDLYWSYLKMFFEVDKKITNLKKLEFVLMAKFYFQTNRGAQVFKKRFFQ